MCATQDDGEDVLLEHDGTNVLREFVHGPGIDDYVAMHIPAGQANAGTYFYHADGLGSVTDMTLQSDSSVQARYEYAPFGAATVLSGSALAATNPYEYTGRRYDMESGLMYYRSRMYDPAARRFAQEDPWGGDLYFSSTYLNKYLYASGNPVSHVDPTGMNDMYPGDSQSSEEMFSNLPEYMQCAYVSCEKRCTEQVFGRAARYDLLFEAFFGMSLGIASANTAIKYKGNIPSRSTFKKGRDFTQYKKRTKWFNKAMSRGGMKVGSKVVPLLGWLLSAAFFWHDLGEVAERNWSDCINDCEK